jgi:hypothetical protein
VVNHDQQLKADVLIEGELIKEVAPNIKVCLSVSVANRAALLSCTLRAQAQPPQNFASTCVLRFAVLFSHTSLPFPWILPQSAPASSDPHI